MLRLILCRTWFRSLGEARPWRPHSQVLRKYSFKQVEANKYKPKRDLKTRMRRSPAIQRVSRHFPQFLPPSVRFRITAKKIFRRASSPSDNLSHTQAKEIDIPLIESVIKNFIDRGRVAYAISMFETLRKLHPQRTLNSEILMRLLMATQNYEEALSVYERLINTGGMDGINHVTDHALLHGSFIQRHPKMMVALLRGLRKSYRSRDYIIAMLLLVPSKAIVSDSFFAAEVLHYAAHWNNRELVRKTLDTLRHPLYDDSYVEPSNHLNSFNFPPKVWTSILSAHVQLGLINSSRLVLESMQANGVQPRREDMSAIISGLAKFDLDSAYTLAMKLAASVTLDTYETLLNIALEKNHLRIVEWAKSFVAYKPATGSAIEAHIPNDEPIVFPRSFGMNSQLRRAMAAAEVPTCTPRAVGTLIIHTAKTKNVQKAIVELYQARMKFPREVIDQLYDIACERDQVDCAMWLAYLMRNKGWIPHAYESLRSRYRHIRRLRVLKRL